MLLQFCSSACVYEYTYTFCNSIFVEVCRWYDVWNRCINELSQTLHCSYSISTTNYLSAWNRSYEILCNEDNILNKTKITWGRAYKNPPLWNIWYLIILHRVLTHDWLKLLGLDWNIATFNQRRLQKCRYYCKQFFLLNLTRHIFNRKSDTIGCAAKP